MCFACLFVVFLLVFGGFVVCSVFDFPRGREERVSSRSLASTSYVPHHGSTQHETPSNLPAGLVATEVKKQQLFEQQVPSGVYCRLFGGACGSGWKPLGKPWSKNQVKNQSLALPGFECTGFRIPFASCEDATFPVIAYRPQPH